MVVEMIHMGLEDAGWVEGGVDFPHDIAHMVIQLVAPMAEEVKSFLKSESKWLFIYFQKVISKNNLFNYYK